MALLDLQGMTADESHGGGSNISVTACQGGSSLSVVACESL